MKKYPLFFILFLTVFLSACQPAANSQPVFTPSADATITPLPLPALHPQTSIHLTGKILSFAIRPDQRSIAIGAGSEILLYDLKTFKLIRSIPEQASEITHLAWSPDGKKLAAGAFVQVSSDLAQAHVLVLDASTWQVLLDDDKLGEVMSNEPIYALAWSSDNFSLAVSIPVFNVIVLDTKTGKTISNQQQFASTVSSVIWSPDGTRLVAAGDMAKSLRRWKVSNDESVRLFDQRLENARQLAWSPDGARIASSHWDGAICFWTVATNTCDSLIQADPKVAYSLAWSADGAKLATGGSTIRIWDTVTGKLLSAFGEDEKGMYTDIQWPAPDQPLVTLQASEYDQPEMTIIRFWDIATGKIMAEFIGEPNSAK